jgi:HD-GYP domain-containing protein (c-di-GMP phosphodiesterase class II)
MSDTTQDAQELIAKALDRARAGEDKELTTQVRERGEQVAHLLSGTSRMTHIHHIDNRAFEAPCRELAASLAKLHDLLGLVQLVMVEDQIYINDIRMRFDVRNEASRELTHLWHRHETGGVTLHAPITEAQVKALVVAVAAEPAPTNPRAALQAALQRAGMATVELQPVFRFRVGNEAQKRQHIDRDVKQVYAQSAQIMGELWDSLAMGRNPNPLPVRKMVTEMVDMSMEQRTDELLLATRDTRSPAHNRHSIQVTALSLLIGKEVGLPEATLADLGVAATFHDGGYTADEDGYAPPFERHTSAGARQLLKQRGFHEARIRRLLVCLEHHRTYDDDRRPSLFSRIVHIADDYDTLTRYRPSGPLIAPPDALARMYAAGGTLYDPVLLQAFVNRMGTYPPGSVLELEDGSWVLSISPVRRPMLFDKPLTRLVRFRGGALPDEDVDIDLAFGRRVARVVRPESPP